MNYRNLGRTGLKVSEIALGSWTTYGGYVDDSESIAIVRRAFEQGINFFDTADVYVRGKAETVLGKALAEIPREQVVIATKVMGRVWDGPLGAGLSRKHIFDAMDQSLRRMNVDYVDLYQLHAPDASTPIEETLRALEDLVRMGKTRYIGFSNFDHDPPLLRRAVAYQKRRGWDPFVSSQPRYNLLEPRIEREHMPFCRRNGIGIINYSPLLQGVLTNKYAGGAKPSGSRATTSFAHFIEGEHALTPENIAATERFAAWAANRGFEAPGPVAIAWVLRRPEISSAIIGASTMAQLEENLKSVDIKLSDAEWREAQRATWQAAWWVSTAEKARAKRKAEAREAASGARPKRAAGARAKRTAGGRARPKARKRPRR